MICRINSPQNQTDWSQLCPIKMTDCDLLDPLKQRLNTLTGMVQCRG